MKPTSSLTQIYLFKDLLMNTLDLYTMDFDSLVKYAQKLGLDAEVIYEDFPENPRPMMDYGSVMLCGHRRYTLGDLQLTGKYRSMTEEVERTIYHEHLEEFWAYLGKDLRERYSSEDYDYETDPDPQDFEAWQDEELANFQPLTNWIEANFIVLPLSMYEHSNITIYIDYPNCQWDSGNLGVIYTRWNPETDNYQAIVDQLKYEVAEYSEYANGEVYKYYIYDDRLEDGESGYLDTSYNLIGREYAFELCKQALIPLIIDRLQTLEDEKEARVKQFGFSLEDSNDF